MKILIISTNRNALPMPVMPLGACVVAEAAERAGHTVHFVDLMFAKAPLATVQSAVVAFNPDVIGLSLRNIDNIDMHDPVFLLDDLRPLADAIRALSPAPVIAGGAAMGVMPEEILRLGSLTCGVAGRGERVFPLLLERIERKKSFEDLPGIVFFENGAVRKNPPFPAEDAGWTMPDFLRWVEVRAYQSHMATVPLQTKTGCPFHCVYCTYGKIEGNAYRLLDPGQIAATVARLASSGLRDIEFVDSVFNEPYGHALAVCTALARVKHRARLQSLELNPRSFDDALLSAMERAGFVGIGITAESASDPVLKKLRKGFTSREVHDAAEIVRRRRLPCAWIFLLGGPGETEASVRETLRFAESAVRPQDVAYINIGLRIYPGTELESIARSDGTLTRRELLSPVFYVTPDVDAAWIGREVKQSMKRRMNIINSNSLGLSLLPALHRAGHRLGLRPPLWRHTGAIRRTLRLLGRDL